jgi:sporulation protein YlmC with PRC-barrel domain
MGTQVITRDTGRRLGVVGEVVVDIDRREVVALGLRDNPLTRFLPGLPRWMPLERIRQVGDVILVDSSDSLAEAFDPERYSKVINCQVITESGQTLGRVLGFSFDIETGELVTLVIGALGVPLLAEGVLSTWELPVAEVVSSGSDRIIVYEGSEDKLKQLGTGLLEKMGIGGNSWEKEERERWRVGPVPAENQLPAGLPSQQEQRRIQPATARAIQPEAEMEYVELEERRQREPLRQRRYLDDEAPRDPYRSPDSDREPEQERFSPADRRPGGQWPRDQRPRDQRPEDQWPEDQWLADQGRTSDREPPPRREVERLRERDDWREPMPGPSRRDFGNGAATDRSWDRPGEGRPRDPEPEPRSREPEPLARSWDRREEERPRRPPAAEPLPRRADRPRGEEPVDVEPEILDDPW